MFVIKRNQVIVTALVVMIAVAGYLNFTESSGSEKGQAAMILNDEGDAYSALLDNGDITPLADDDPNDLADNSTTAQTAATDIQAADTQTASTDPITAEAVAEGSEDDTGAAILVNADAVDSDTYFVQAKLDREQARSKQKDILAEMINNENIEKEQKAACATSMLDIQKRIEKETAAESMIESKGFSDSYVRIDDETVDVVVSKPTLSEAEVAQIMDIVKRKTGFNEDKIRISPLKTNK